MDYSYRKGKSKSLQHRQKISESNIKTKRGDKLFTQKELNVLERKGMRYRDWQKAVFTHDDYTCVRCGKRGWYLNAHHIMEFAQYPELRYDPDNGVTLCLDCHYSIVHSKDFLADVQNLATGCSIRNDYACVF